MNRSPRLALLMLTVSLAGAFAASPRAPQDPSKTQPGQAGRKNPPPGARGFEQFAGRDAADKLIKGAATRRSAPERGMSGTAKRKPPQLSPLETHVREAEKQRAAGNFVAAVAAYQKAIELRGQTVSDNGELEYALGKVYSDMERYEEAAAEFQSASTRRPASDVALYATYELGNAYLDLGKYAEASAAYEKTLKILTGEWAKSNPSLSARYLPYPHYSMGLAHIGSGQKEQAVSDFEKAIELKPDFHEAHFNLGLTLWQLGRHDAARATENRLRAINAGLADKLAALFK
jgi:tetratricopeptide (TPR) repeat protein